MTIIDFKLTYSQCRQHLLIVFGHQKTYGSSDLKTKDTCSLMKKNEIQVDGTKEMQGY